MKKSIAYLLLLALLLPLLCACASPAPAAPAESPEEPIEETPAPSPTPEPVPEALALGFTLPAAVDEDGDEIGLYYSPREEHNCCFNYPLNCALWEEEDGTIRISPIRWFARIIFTPISRSAEDAPAAMLDLLEPGKWGSVPSEVTVGDGVDALRMSNTKYDTYRRWIVWETEDHFYLLYGVCFDRYEDSLNDILDVVASSFRKADSLSVELPESGTLLRSEDGLRLSYSDASCRIAEEGAELSLTITVENRSDSEAEFIVTGGTELPFEARCAVPANHRLDWSFALPDAAALAPFGEEGAELTLIARAAGAELPLTTLPIRITIHS